MRSTALLLLMLGGGAVSLVSGVDYLCSFTYLGACHQCPYQFEIKDCHREGPRTIYRFGKIYTADPSDPDWDK